MRRLLLITAIVAASAATAACTPKGPPTTNTAVPDNASNHPNPDDECPRRDGQPCK